MLSRNDLQAFEREFPDGDACLEWLKDQIFPDGIFCESCGRVTKHHRVRSRKSYSCDRCGHHVHPTAGTIYHKSRTPLTKWFYATFLLSSVDPDIPITELQKELGVTYKTAWRMTHLIRGMLSEDEEDPEKPEHQEHQEHQADDPELGQLDLPLDEPVKAAEPRARPATPEEARGERSGGGLFGRLTRRERPRRN